MGIGGVAGEEVADEPLVLFGRAEVGLAVPEQDHVRHEAEVGHLMHDLVEAAEVVEVEPVVVAVGVGGGVGEAGAPVVRGAPRRR